MRMYRFLFGCLCIVGLAACGGESDSNPDEPTTPISGSTPEPTLPSDPEPTVPSTPDPNERSNPEPTATPTPGPSEPNATCSPISIIPTASGCNGISLTDEAALISKTPDFSVTTGEDGIDIFHFSEEQFMTLKDDGCYQFGQESDSFSIAFWLKTDEWIGDISHHYIMGNRKRTASDNQGFFFQASNSGKGTARLDIHSKSESEPAVLTVSDIFPTGEWVHLVVSYSSKKEQFTIHTNTKPKTGRAPKNIFNPNGSLMIGGDADLSEGNFQISELTFYTDPLTQNQIEALFKSTSKNPLPTTQLNDIINSLNKHITGETTLSDNEITQLTNEFLNNRQTIIDDETYIRDTLALIENFESSHGALFTTPKTRNGFSRAESDDGLTLERNMLRIQQAAHDQIYSDVVLSDDACRTLLDGKFFASTNFFPGAVAPPENPKISYAINVDATLNRYQGMRIAFDTEDARRPTGKYVAPGSIAKVTVPESMVNAGFSILVGAHSTDHRNKPNIRRFDRVFSTFPITKTETFVSNPFGGGIYINVPYLSDLGIQEITIENVLQAPFYSTKAENKTTLAQWLAYRESSAPWADFETDNFMMQVPTNWIYQMENPQSLMEEWEAVMDGMTELKGMTPEQRNRKVLYVQVDSRNAHGGFNGIGYPQVNITYRPESDEQGLSNHHLLTRPGGSSTMIHELTHAEQIFGFGGSEVEAIAYFPAVYIRMEKLGMNFEEAVGDGSAYDGDEAAVNWMVTPNFRNGLEMDRSGESSDETRYQRRGFMKYVDIARLFGWDTIKAFYKEMNDNADAGTSNNIEGLSAADSIKFRYSKIAGADLRPLFHFWGRHPEDNTALAKKLAEHGLSESSEVLNRLNHYSDIAPKNSAEFAEHHELLYPGKPVDANDYGKTMYTELSNTFDESYNSQIKERIQDIIKLYYQDGGQG